MTFDMKVQHTGLETTAGDLRASARRIEQRLDRLEQRLDKLKPQWSGEASASYVQARGRWDTAMREMKTLLASIGESVGAANQEYAAADRRGASRFEV